MDESPFENCFFHYTTRRAAFEHIIPSEKLKMSSLRQMRDPMENKLPRFAAGSINSNAQKDFETFALFHMYSDEIAESARLLALTVDADDPDGRYEGLDAPDFGRGYARARMWEHYAEQHEGVCLIFDQEALETAIRASLADKDLAQPYAKRVEYTPTGRSENPMLDLSALAGKVTPQLVAKFAEDNHEELFFRKTLDWETEYEFRFLVTTEPAYGELFVHFRQALRAVLVGEKFPLWERPGAIEASKEIGAEPLRLDWEMGRPVIADLRPARKGKRGDILQTLVQENPPEHQPPPAEKPPPS